MGQGRFEKCDKIPFDMPVNCVFYWEPMMIKTMFAMKSLLLRADSQDCNTC
jgi:hypothetical protein